MLFSVSFLTYAESSCWETHEKCKVRLKWASSLASWLNIDLCILSAGAQKAKLLSSHFLEQHEHSGVCCLNWSYLIPRHISPFHLHHFCLCIAACNVICSYWTCRLGSTLPMHSYSMNSEACAQSLLWAAGGRGTDLTHPGTISASCSFTCTQHNPLSALFICSFFEGRI